MNLQTIRGKKSLKLLFLLLTSLLIGTVSATIYSYMYINGTVTIGTQQIIWVKGSDAPGTGSVPGSTTISGGTVTMNLNVQPGQNQTFTYCLYLKNQDSVSHNMTISVTTPLSGTDFNSARIHLYDNATAAFIHTIGMTTNDSYATSPLSAAGIYRLAFEVYAKTGATGSHNFNIQVEYQ